MKQTTVPRRSLAPEARASSHDRILGAAKDLFASKGYDNASTAAIARLAGTSESQLIKHFGSKEGLLESIFEQAWQKLNWGIRQSLQSVSSPAEKLRVLVDMTLSGFERDPQVKLLLLLEGRHISKEGRMILLTQGFLDFVRLLDGLLEEMRAAHLIRSDLHLEGVRSALMGAFEGMLRDQILSQRIRYPAHYNVKHVREIFGALLDSFLSPSDQPASGDARLQD